MPKGIIFIEVKFFIYVPLFLFFVLPTPTMVLNFSTSLELASQEMNIDAETGLFPHSDTERGDEDESEKSSRLAIDDDDKLPHCPSWGFQKPVQMYSDYNDVYLLDGISRRLFKPPKA